MDKLFDSAVYPPIGLHTLRALLALNPSMKRRIESGSVLEYLVAEPAVDENPLSSLILSHITRDRPSGAELLDWMIGLDRVDLREAALLTLEGWWSPSRAYIQALLFSLLYPRITLEDVKESMRTAGLEDREIESGLQLAHAQRERNLH